MDYLDGPNVIMRLLNRGKQEESNLEEGDVIIESEFGMMCFEDGRRGHNPRKAEARLQKLEKVR